MQLYAACDLHSNNTVLAVIDAAGAQRYRHRLPNDLAVIDAALMPFRDELTGIAVESTCNAYWLIDGLQAMGYPAKMVNTLAVPQYAGLKHGDDDSDAMHLAELMRLGLLPLAYIYPREQRPLRDLLRRRLLLVQQSVRLLQSVQGYWARATGQRLGSDAFRKLNIEQLKTTFADPTELFAVLNLVQAWRTLQDRIAEMEAWLTDEMRRDARLIGLRTVPGIGIVLGLTIVLESGDIHRFDDVGQYASYCRMVPALRFSNGKKKGHRQPQVRQPVPGLGMDGGGQLRDPLRSADQALVPAPQGEEIAPGRAQGSRTQTGAGRLSPVARWRRIRHPSRLCLRFAVVSPEMGPGEKPFL
jgi:transposase